MPRFYFDLHNDVDSIDDEGKDLPDLSAAKANAAREVRELVSAGVMEHGKVDLRHYIQVRDEAGADVLRVHFEDAVTVTRGNDVLSRPLA